MRLFGGQTERGQYTKILPEKQSTMVHAPNMEVKCMHGIGVMRLFVSPKNACKSKQNSRSGKHVVGQLVMDSGCTRYIMILYCDW